MSSHAYTYTGASVDRKSMKSRELFSVLEFFLKSFSLIWNWSAQLFSIFLSSGGVSNCNIITVVSFFFFRLFRIHVVIRNFDSDYIYVMSSLKIIPHGSVILRVTQTTHLNTKRCYFLVRYCMYLGSVYQHCDKFPSHLTPIRHLRTIILRGLSPRANYTDRATAAGRRS